MKGKKELTLLVALQIAVELWTWLKETGAGDKADWSGWEKYGQMAHNCPLCEYAETPEELGDGSCEMCPLGSRMPYGCEYKKESKYAPWRELSKKLSAKGTPEIKLAAAQFLAVLEYHLAIELAKQTVFKVGDRIKLKDEFEQPYYSWGRTDKWSKHEHVGIVDSIDGDKLNAFFGGLDYTYTCRASEMEPAPPERIRLFKIGDKVTLKSSGEPVYGGYTYLKVGNVSEVVGYWDETDKAWCRSSLQERGFLPENELMVVFPGDSFICHVDTTELEPAPPEEVWEDVTKDCTVEKTYSGVLLRHDGWTILQFNPNGIRLPTFFPEGYGLALEGSKPDTYIASWTILRRVTPLPTGGVVDMAS